MNKRNTILFLGFMLFLAGCVTVQYPTVTQPTAVALDPTATQTAQQVIYVTATPDPITATAASTQVPASITITGLVDNGSGLASIYWETSGDFPAGFELVWSDVDVNPTFPGDPSMYISNPNKRSAQIQGELGKIYYVRLCRYVSNSCDAYSPVGIIGFVAPSATPTLTPTATATPKFLPMMPPLYKTPVTSTYSSEPYIYISSIKSTGAGAALIYWTAYGDFPNGFLILYSEGTTVPSYGDYSSYKISDGSDRSATVIGGFGSTYTFVICRWTGTTCDTYSNAYEYTFAAVTPTRTPGSGGYPPLGPPPLH
jgi:hypothetical protein